MPDASPWLADLQTWLSARGGQEPQAATQYNVAPVPGVPAQSGGGDAMAGLREAVAKAVQAGVSRRRTTQMAEEQAHQQVMQQVGQGRPQMPAAPQGVPGIPGAMMPGPAMGAQMPPQSQGNMPFVQAPGMAPQFAMPVQGAYAPPPQPAVPAMPQMLPTIVKYPQ